MLKVFTGKNSNELRARIEKELGELRKKKRSVVTVTDASFSPAAVSSYLGDQDLFGQTYAIFLDRISSNTEARDFFWDNLEALTESPNEFLLLEEKLSAENIKAIEKVGGGVYIEKAVAAKPKELFNIFSLADALGERNKKNLWVLYEKALRQGKTPEEIAGVFFWQIKSMLALSGGGGKVLNPYVKSKATRFLKQYSEEELKKLSSSLVRGYHESRRRGFPLEGKLEQFILSL